MGRGGTGEELIERVGLGAELVVEYPGRDRPYRLSDLSLLVKNDGNPFGYAQLERLNSQKRARIERALVAVANELQLSLDELRVWSASKWVRWLCDGVKGRNEPPTRETLRRYLNEEIVANLLEEVAAWQ